MRKLTLPTVLFGFICLIFPLIFVKVRAGNTASVTATVIAQNISVSVADGSISYSTMSIGASATTALGDGDSLSDTQVATNDGNVSEQFNVSGTNSANWTIGSNPAANVYSHDFCVSNCDVSPTWTPLTTGYQTLAVGVTPAGTEAFDLRLRMPTSSTVYTSQSVNVTVQAVSSI
ncbi:MAG TPA: hypothetical protein VF828_02835 [Patescibacteria group bacterium]